VERGEGKEDEATVAQRSVLTPGKHSSVTWEHIVNSSFIHAAASRVVTGCIRAGESARNRGCFKIEGA